MPTGVPKSTKICKICGKEFMPIKIADKYCKEDHYISCPICGKLMIWNSLRQPEPCSKECRKQLRIQRCREKYGVDHPMQSKEVQANHQKSMLEKYGVTHALKSEELRQHAIETNRERFGADWALGNKEFHESCQETMLEKYGGKTTWESEILTEKYKSTMIERYGVDNAGKSQELRNKAIDTLIEKYGVDNPMKFKEFANKMAESRKDHIDEIVEHIRQSFLERYGVDNCFKSQEIKDKIVDTFMKKYGVKSAIEVPEFREKMQNTMIERHGVPWYVLSGNVKYNHISKINEEFGKKLDEAKIPYEFEYRISTKSYDIRLLDGSNTLIEINPTYTHNAIGNHWGEGLEADYHLMKTEIAESKGYRCIHIFDWDNQDMIIDMLRPRKRIHARECTVYRLKKEVADAFLKEFDLDGTCRGQLLCLGLVKDNVLYQVMIFGKSRSSKKHDVEMLRMCTRSGYYVAGGASKLFSYATSEYGLYNIVAYCDRSKFSGDVFEKIGMKFVKKTTPSIIWSKEDKKITSGLLYRLGYAKLMQAPECTEKSNELYMLEDGWVPVYNCGQSIYEFI